MTEDLENELTALQAALIVIKNLQEIIEDREEEIEDLKEVIDQIYEDLAGPSI